MTVKILVVDDEKDMQELIMQQFRKEVKRCEYKFNFASNGTEALAKIENEELFDLILLDINMQVMDGFKFLTKLRDLKKELIKTIIISAYGQQKNIRTAMNLGAFDFVTKPIDFADLKSTIKKCLRNLLPLIELDSIQKELKLAAKIQSSMLRNDFAEFSNGSGLNIYAKTLPAKQVGGDFYDYFRIDDHRLGIVVGDVSGKGVPAAIFMAVSKNILKNTAINGIAPNTCLDIVNKELCDISPSSLFVTIFYGIFDTKDGSFEYCCGGHNPPYLISKGGQTHRFKNCGGLAPGIIKNRVYESMKITVKKGEIIFIYTDGILDAGLNKEEGFGENRLKNILSQIYNLSVDQIIGKIFEEVQFFSRNEPEDDMTCLALRL